jgi:hypothetical protein
MKQIKTLFMDITLYSSWSLSHYESSNCNVSPDPDAALPWPGCVGPSDGGIGGVGTLEGGADWLGFKRVPDEFLLEFPGGVALLAVAPEVPEVEAPLDNRR